MAVEAESPGGREGYPARVLRSALIAGVVYHTRHLVTNPHLRLARPRGSVALLGLPILLLMPREVHAYIDPGTGSMVLQLVVGAALAFFFTWKRFWHRVRALISQVLRRRKRASRDDDQDDDQE